MNCYKYNSKGSTYYGHPFIKNNNNVCFLFFTFNNQKQHKEILTFYNIK